MNINGEMEKRNTIYVNNILNFFYGIADVSVNKHYSNNKQGNQAHFF
jgi:hypothetical protein